MNKTSSALFLTILLAPPILVATHQDVWVIGNITADGFFANFITVLNHLLWCEETNKTPFVYWDTTNYYYQKQGYNGSTNVWEYYFEQVSTIALPPNKKAVTSCPSSKKIISNYNNNELTPIWRGTINEIIKKYIIVKPEVLAKVIDFYDKWLLNKPTVGIHVRGTDIKNAGVTPVPLNNFIAAAKQYDGYQYFIASDEQQIIEQITASLNDKGKTISYPSHRSLDGTPIHSVNMPNKAILGEEVLIEALLLSMCNIFVHGKSSVSTVVLFFNPDLIHIDLSIE